MPEITQKVSAKALQRSTGSRLQPIFVSMEEQVRAREEQAQLDNFLRHRRPGVPESQTWMDFKGHYNPNYDSTKSSPIEKHKKDANWIDMDQLKAWIYGCNARHGAHCDPIRKDKIAPYWLIDTSDACIVHAATSVTYVALSYVWGSTTSGLACQDNLEQLQEPGSLLSPAMPRTIRDVISVVRLLGERYLWVDRLCIVQDDDKDKNKHINNMASIYSNACMTLVVATGDDAEHWLRGISGISLKSATVPRPSYKWYTRGWTLQEIVFSRRALYFTETGAFWECHCHTWSEDTPTTDLSWCNSKCNNKLSDIFRDSYFPSWPNLHMYLQLVAAYSNRQLTFDEDIVAAFIFLDVALLWRPMGPCRRRVPPEGERNKPCAALPSWSWVGWQTEVDPRSWKCGYDYLTHTNVVAWPGSIYDEFLKTASSWKLEPTVQWYVADGLSSPTRPVIGDYKQHQRYRETPAGWSRYKLPFESPEEAEFAHVSGMKTRFRFPLPLPSDKDASRGSIRAGPFLFCRTTRAYLLMEALLPCRIVSSLYDKDKTWAGVIRMQVEEEGFARPATEGKMIELPDGDEDCDEGGNSLRKEEEFIAISEGSARDGWDEAGFLEEWCFAERAKHTLFYEFFNVLCVMRRGGICYRKGVGRVLKSVWASQEPETLEVHARLMRDDQPALAVDAANIKNM
ncbi:HET-domain-containing protein [Nemania sp. NC0429]|nr:HET-domain-containing protein [Nemania sp. NC0429]